MTVQDQPGEANDLQRKILEWLERKGYPLEFAAAEAFRQRGFRVLQGEHYSDPERGVPREIDLLAEVTSQVPSGYLRVAHVVECKRSREKPWVFFTSPKARMYSAACVAQTIGSAWGHAALWCLAGEVALHETSAFAAPENPAFGGVQALKARGRSEADVVYAALQSVVSASIATAAKYDDPRLPQLISENFAFVALPLVVVDGNLFRVSLDAGSSQIKAESTNWIRVHWRGAERWEHHSSIDVVTADYLDDFVKRRKSEMPLILEHLARACDNIAACMAAGSLEKLRVSEGSRGILGLPPLLEALSKRASGEENRRESP